MRGEQARSGVKGRGWAALVAVAAMLLAGCSADRHDTPATVVTQIETVTATPSSSPVPEAQTQDPPETTTAQTATTTQTETTTAQAGPAIGTPCIGADTGKRAVDPSGTAIVCDQYQWRADTGQQPGHSWADDQTAWMECLETHTQDECRALLNH
ncbi:hypothetical protein MYK68_13455 [Gordonia sp. PP30]|uniref:hypothetical protein n=1 Tax=unclassified Gordonia (in: high G+C Gram-positive bacteria) TaxID=2657482 RepID=UPI001FFEA77B|nr:MULTISPECIES: hypothetical protein [unclassified Gordonia (in: high G+C Gram-positive bacteria)]UQE73742.1 hypothetical protein MYK68_13455 [Gordonia sp. PP30]